jgi:hypothetical protein
VLKWEVRASLRRGAGAAILEHIIAEVRIDLIP